MNELGQIYKTLEKIERGVSISSSVSIKISKHCDGLEITVIYYFKNTPLYSWIEITRQEMIGICNHDILIGCFIMKTNRVFKQLIDKHRQSR